jgi:hypothetical protein
MATCATTLGLIFLPRLLAPAQDLLSQARRIENPIYILRMWVGIIHPLLVIVGAAGVLLVRLRAAAGAAICGFVFFAFWAVLEGVQQSLILVALNWRWRTAYLAGPDSVRETLRPIIEGFEAVSDGLFFFLVLVFIVANVFFCAATWSGGRLQRVAAACFAVSASLGVVSFLTEYGGRFAPGGAMDIAYPLLGPAGRLLTGVWLWQESSRLRVTS